MKRILIIEDEPQHIMLVKMRLEVNGFEVIAAQNGADGVAAAAQYPPDLVLMDLMLPDMQAKELIDALHALPATANTPVIAFTALDPAATLRRGITRDIAGFIQKPYETSELLEKINGVLAGKHDTPPRGL